MLQELRNFFSGYPEDFGFQIDEEVFLQGLKFSRREKYPWRSRKDMKDFFEKLYTHKSADSYQKIIEWKTILHQEQIHVLHSWAFLLRFSSMLMISACLVLFALQHPLSSEVVLGTGILMLISDAWLRRKASKYRQSWIEITGLLNTMIKQQEQVQEDEQGEAA
jgi:hypothetical protein